MNPKVEFFFEAASIWKEHIELLRNVALSTGLEETLKWGCPCYMHKGKNIVLIHYFKNYAALLFFKGALMNNEHGLLIHQSKEVQVPRQMRFTGVDEIKHHLKTIKACILEAVAVEESGISIPKKKVEDYPLPQALEAMFKMDKNFKSAFYKLTPGRQRAYLLHFGKAKREETVIRRIEASKPHILAGKGLMDQL